MVEVVIAWKGKSMGKFELGRAPSFECRVFSYIDNKILEPYVIFHPHVFTFSFTLTFWELRDILLRDDHSPFTWKLFGS